MRRTAVLAVAVSTALGAGCAFGSTVDNPFQGGAGGERTIRVEVRNFNFADATIFVFRGTERIRLGTVTGKTDADYQVEWTLTQPLRVEIDLLAGDRCSTRTMDVSPGEVIGVQVPLDLSSDPDCR